MKNLLKLLGFLAILNSEVFANSIKKNLTQCKRPVKQNITAIEMIRYEKNANGTECKWSTNLVFQMQTLRKKQCNFSKIFQHQSQSFNISANSELEKACFRV